MQIVRKKGEPIGFSIEKAIKVMPLTFLVTHMRLIILQDEDFYLPKPIKELTLRSFPENPQFRPNILGQ